MWKKVCFWITCPRIKFSIIFKSSCFSSCIKFNDEIQHSKPRREWNIKGIFFARNRHTNLSTYPILFSFSKFKQINNISFFLLHLNNTYISESIIQSSNLHISIVFCTMFALFFGQKLNYKIYTSRYFIRNVDSRKQQLWAFFQLGLYALKHNASLNFICFISVK